MADIKSNLLAFWGKAMPSATSPDAARYHPCLFHCLDVAATAIAILDARPRLLKAIANGLGWSTDDALHLLPFLVTLHDIGKLSLPFQALAPKVWPTSVLGPWQERATLPRHDAAAWFLLERLELPVLAAWPPRQRDALLAPIIGHHGRPTTFASERFDEAEVYDAACLEAAAELVRVAKGVFRPPGISAPDAKALSRVGWLIAGLTVLADWVGSNQRWFAYREPDLDPEAYFESVACPQAAVAVTDAGLWPARCRPFAGFAALTESTFAPTDAQQWATAVHLPNEPCLAIIEDLTGSGKTEAALVLAHRLLAADRASGLYVALPTMATANAMYRRLADTYRRMFDDGDRPSLALAHGAASLDGAFRASILPIDDAKAAASEENPRDQAQAACAAWLADDRRKAFLADVGVGTIDQALLAVLPAKYQSLRLLGLADKVLIVDEAHAYDAYMSEELDRLLTFHAALGGSAIVLSATLPSGVRQRLIGAFATGRGATLGELTEADYPMASLVTEGGIEVAPCSPRSDLRRELRVTHVGDVTSVLVRIVTAAATGAAVAWVRNTVDDAIAGWQALHALGIEATLFHARFAMGDRQAIERDVVDRFGRQSDPARRAGVVVATQVIEQSLDLDFDLLVSDLAPIDLLLQRAGRLHRHVRAARPVPEPELVVLSPDPECNVDRDWLAGPWAGTSYVYTDHTALWLTAKHLFARARIAVPEDVQRLVEVVYADGRTAVDVPERFARNREQAEGTDHAARSMARANLLSSTKGYHGHHDGWDAENHVPTRLGDETLTVRLARIDGDRIMPWSDEADLRLAWALSEVRVRPGQVRELAVPAGLARAAETVRATWSRFDRDMLLLPLEPEEAGTWRPVASTEAQRRVRYSAKLGLWMKAG